MKNKLLSLLGGLIVVFALVLLPADKVLAVCPSPRQCLLQELGFLGGWMSNDCIINNNQWDVYT